MEDCKTHSTFGSLRRVSVDCGLCYGIWTMTLPVKGCKFKKPTVELFLTIGLFWGNQCLLIIETFLVCWDVILWVTDLFPYNEIWLRILLCVRGDMNSWVRVTHEINQHWSSSNSNDSTV